MCSQAGAWEQVEAPTALGAGLPTPPKLDFPRTGDLRSSERFGQETGHSASRHKLAARRAFSLVEVLVATMIMGVLLVAAMQTVGNSVRAERSNADKGIGFGLAQQLMSEVLVARYVEPDDTPAFGPEVSETGGTRSAFDDVDDYHNWTASPPQDPDGTQIPDRASWEREVTVEYVNPNDLTTTVGTDQGVKRITVTVKRNDAVVAQLMAVRTDTDQDDD